MPIADCRLPDYEGKVEMDGKRPNEPRDNAGHTGEARSASHSAIRLRECCGGQVGNRQSAFTLVETLVVIGIIGILAGLLASAILYARNLSIRTECQQNLNHIGQTVSLLVLSNNGLFPIGPPVNNTPSLAGSGLSNAYPKPQVTTAGGTTSNDFGFPWWARVFEQWEGDMGLLFAKNANGTYVTDSSFEDDNFNPIGFVLNAQLPKGQLPPTMNGFRCRMGGALDGSSVANLFNSISYGINFDVKDAGPLANNASPQPRPYCASSPWSPSVLYKAGDVVLYNGAMYTCIAAESNYLAPTNTGVWQSSPNYSLDFSNNVLSTADKYPDQYRATEIQNPGAFILISEASTQGIQWLPPPFPQPLQWSASTAYAVWNIVRYNGVAYTCTAANSNCLPPNYPNDWKPGYLTGGRISMSYPQGPGYQRGSSDMPPNNAPIVGRHSGYANVLFADFHVEAVQIVPGQTTANMNINYNTPLWTLPGK
jgi:prepilin-type processing-associated H-X9-DG protein/prepilin-type N-terminal cleavage/methylation domain-containing protein